MFLSERSEARGSERREEGMSERSQKTSVPEPIMTKDNKYKCPLDQEEYDNKEDYDAHCVEEHDVL